MLTNSPAFEFPFSMALTALDTLVIAAYLALLFGIGLRFSRRQTSRDEYFLGNRDMHWFLVGGSIMATLLSTITFLSVPGEMIRYGLAYFVGTLAFPFIIPFLNRMLIPVLMRLPITSVYEYLERRFDRRTRKLVAAIFIVRTVLWSGLILYTASFAVVEMAGWPLLPTIAALGVLTTIYTTAGGMRTVIWTDNIQLWILFGGSLAVALVVGFRTGDSPAVWWQAFQQAGRTEVQVFSFDLTVRMTLVGVMLHQFFWNLCTHGSDQVAVQRYLSTPSLAAARRSLWVFTWVKLSLYVFLLGSALALFHFYVGSQPGTSALEADKFLPRFIARELPAGVSGLLLAALLAAAMSSLSSAINSVSGVVVNDFVPAARTHASLFLDKALAVGAGLVGTAAALALVGLIARTNWNLIELTGRVNHIFVGPIGALFFLGILARRVGRQAAAFGFVAGSAVSLYICFGKEWFGLEKSISFLWVVPGSFAATFAAALLCAPWFPAPDRERIAQLVWRG
ncbi:MAG: sodium/solute symporter [Bryobacterales bacterium]|nr:sodium/solute symporter [Bryobacterales bacterium]